jgi:hypothetical protein
MLFKFGLQKYDFFYKIQILFRNFIKVSILLGIKVMTNGQLSLLQYNDTF